MEQLLHYIVKEAPKDAEKKRTFKYGLACVTLRTYYLTVFFNSMLSCRFPFIACEIFICEVDIILRTLVEDEEVFFYILFPFDVYISF